MISSPARRRLRAQTTTADTARRAPPLHTVGGSGRACTGFGVARGGGLTTTGGGTEITWVATTGGKAKRPSSAVVPATVYALFQSSPLGMNRAPVEKIAVEEIAVGEVVVGAVVVGDVGGSNDETEFAHAPSVSAIPTIAADRIALNRIETPVFETAGAASPQNP